jgi:mono/diheme cytochrome c family protein
MHAMWTLEGLGALDASLVRSAMQDQDPRMRVQAIRASETLYKAGNRTFEADYRTMAKDAEPDVVIQALLTLNVLKIPDVADVVKSAQAATKARGVKEIGDLIVRPPATGRGGGRGGAALAPEQQQLIDQGGRIFNELCFSCHGEDGRGRPQAGSANGMLAPPLAGSPRVNGHRDYIIKTLLKGMTGPLGDNSYSEVMVPMGTNNDDWIASVASYVRTSFGNSAGFVTPADVARVRAATANRKAPWTLAELEPTLPRRLDPDPATWKVTASQNSATAASALSMNTWTSGAPQAPGMWFQIELPQPVMLAEIEFDSPAGARGGGGRGGAPTAAMFPYPRGYRVEVSLDGAKWGTKPVAEGKGSGAHTTITFAPVRAKFLRISETETAEPAASWAMSNVRLNEAGSK